MKCEAENQTYHHNGVMIKNGLVGVLFLSKLMILLSISYECDCLTTVGFLVTPSSMGCVWNEAAKPPTMSPPPSSSDHNKFVKLERRINNLEARLERQTRMNLMMTLHLSSIVTRDSILTV